MKRTQTELSSASSACRFCSLLTPFLQTVEFTGPQWPLSACHATPPLLRCHPSFLMGIVETVELPCCHGSKHFHIFPTLPAQCATTKLEGSEAVSGQFIYIYLSISIDDYCSFTDKVTKALPDSSGSIIENHMFHYKGAFTTITSTQLLSCRLLFRCIYVKVSFN